MALHAHYLPEGGRIGKRRTYAGARRPPTTLASRLPATPQGTRARANEAERIRSDTSGPGRSDKFQTSTAQVGRAMANAHDRVSRMYHRRLDSTLHPTCGENSPAPPHPGRSAFRAPGENAKTGPERGGSQTNFHKITQITQHARLASSASHRGDCLGGAPRPPKLPRHAVSSQRPSKQVTPSYRQRPYPCAMGGS